MAQQVETNKTETTRATPARATQQGITPEQSTGVARTQEEPRWLSPPLRSPFGMMRRMMEDMDRMFEEFGMGSSSLPFGRDFLQEGALRSVAPQLWSPQIEVSEREGKLLVKADLPGLTTDDIKLQVLDNALVIQGERQQERQEQRGGYNYSERSYGSFSRRIPLPEGVRSEDVDATFQNGVLEIACKLPAQASARTIEIKSGEASGSAASIGAGKASGGTSS